MDAQTLLELCARHHKRTHVIGDLSFGVIAGLDLEGRLYLVRDGEVVSRVNREALSGVSGGNGATGWLNPGGDGLWPAPEGSRLGYLYATGAWRVPPAMTSARYQVHGATATSAVIRADIDLVNAQALGIPVRFERQVAVTREGDDLVVTCEESITYLGARDLSQHECLLAPWSLSQFDCGPGCEVIFPDAGSTCVWDLYGPSPLHRTLRDGVWHVRTDGSARFQLGLSAEVPWIELRLANGLRVRREAVLPVNGHDFIDIADRPAHSDPESRGCRYSIYSDVSGFMEVEAVGGMPLVLKPGMRLSVHVTTRVTRANMHG